MSCCERIDYYLDFPRPSPVEIARLTPYTDGIAVPSVGGFTENAPLSNLPPVEAVILNAGIDPNIIIAGIQFGYLPAWTPTASIGQFAIGMSAIFTLTQYHNFLFIINGVVIEIPWSGPYPFFLDISQLDGSAVLL